MDHRQFDDAAHLQRQVDADWHELNTECPSRARGCDGQPPVVAHPELLSPRRPYRPEWENEIFDLGRVDRYLGTFSWTRTMSQSGQVNLGGQVYGLGKMWAGQMVSVGFELEGRRFVFTQLRPATKAGQLQPKLEPNRKPARGLSQTELTGLTNTLAELPTRQLMFPLLLMGSSTTSPPGA